MLRRALLALSILATPVLAAPQGGDGVRTAWYNLHPIAAANGSWPEGVHMNLHVSTSFLGSLEPSVSDVYGVWEGDDEISMGVVVNAVESAIRDDPVAEVSSVRSFRGRLEVIGNDAAHAVAERTVEELTSVIDDGASIEVFRVSDGAIPAGTGSVLTAEAAGALISTLNDVAVSRGHAPFSRRTHFGREKVHSFVAGYDAEVAQGAIAAKPNISIIRSGLHVGVKIDLAADGRRIITRVWGRDGAHPELRTVALEKFAGAELELPSTQTSLFTSSAMLEPGGALVIDHDSGGEGALVVRVVPDADNSTEIAMPIGEFAMTGMRIDPIFLPSASPTYGLGRSNERLALSTAPWFDQEMDPVQYISELLDLPKIGSVVIPIRGRAYVGARSADGARLAKGLADLASSVDIATFDLDIRYATTPTAEIPMQFGADDLRALAEAPDTRRLLGSAIEGDTMLLLGGIESAYLRDHAVQISAGAVIAEPITATIFSGICIWCSPVSHDPERASAWFDVNFLRSSGIDRTKKLASYEPAAGDGEKNAPVATGAFGLDLEVELPESTGAAARTLVSMAYDEWTLIMLQPIPGEGESLVVLARPTWN